MYDIRIVSLRNHQVILFLPISIEMTLNDDVAWDWDKSLYIIGLTVFCTLKWTWKWIVANNANKYRFNQFFFLFKGKKFLSSFMLESYILVFNCYSICKHTHTSILLGIHKHTRHTHLCIVTITPNWCVHVWPAEFYEAIYIFVFL